jgi:hypothetical protein
MSTEPYKYTQADTIRYTFASEGKNGVIVKLVEFSQTSQKGIFNFGFGDLNNDGFVDDTANSNNGDLTRVLSTVIHILVDFTNQYKEYKIVFTGSTLQRTMIYQQILNRHYLKFSKVFIITGLTQMDSEKYFEEDFNPDAPNTYIAFFIKRKQ